MFVRTKSCDLVQKKHPVNQTPVKTLFISDRIIFYLVSLQRFNELCDVIKGGVACDVVIGAFLF